MAESVATGLIYHLLGNTVGRSVLQLFRRRARRMIQKCVIIKAGSAGYNTGMQLPELQFSILAQNLQPSPLELRRAVISIFLGGCS